MDGGTLEKFLRDANEKLLERSWRDIILMWVAPLLLGCDFYCAQVSVMTGVILKDQHILFDDNTASAL